MTGWLPSDDSRTTVFSFVNHPDGAVSVPAPSKSRTSSVCPGVS